MCLAALLLASGISLLTASHHHQHHHHVQQHAFRNSVREPHIVELPVHSWGNVDGPTAPTQEGDIGLHASSHHVGFQRALENAEKEVHEEQVDEKEAEEQVDERASAAHTGKHHVDFQHALENAEKEAHREQGHVKKVKHHMGFQRALKNAEDEVLSEQVHQKKAREAKEERAEAKWREAEQKELEEKMKKAQEAREAEDLRLKELKEADEEEARLAAQNSRRLMSKRERFNPFDAVKKGFEDASEATKKAIEKTKKGLKDIYDASGKPLMGPINTMRAELCIRRKPLLTHKPCMKFMIRECKEKSTGKGYCKKFFHMVLDACYRAQEQGEDPEGYCELSEQLGSSRDVDEDGVPDITDRFPSDREEWADMDNDGIGDNSDPDRDGDGLPNEADEFPDDPTRPEQTTGDMDGDGIPDEEDDDMDGDGYNNTAEAFPRDPLRPGYPSPAPAPAEPEPEAPAAAPGPSGPGKSIRGLPEQGYGEYHRGNLVVYKDGDDYSGDWQGEWPQKDETHADSVIKACKDHYKSSWCMRFLKKHEMGLV